MGPCIGQRGDSPQKSYAWRCWFGFAPSLYLCAVASWVATTCSATALACRSLVSATSPKGPTLRPCQRDCCHFIIRRRGGHMMSPRFLLAFVMLLFWASATGPVISAESSPAESAAAADKLLSAYHALKAGDVAGARLGFLDVRRMAPGTEQAAEATLRLGYLSEKDKRREEAIGFWVAVTRECVEAPQVAEAAYRLGHTALAADDAKLAEEWFIRGASQKSAPVQMGQLCRANAGFACVSQYWRSRDNRALGRRPLPRPLRQHHRPALPVRWPPGLLHPHLGPGVRPAAVGRAVLRPGGWEV